MTASPLPLPVAFELTPPQHWRTVDLLSDLHLCAAMPRTFEAFAQHLTHTQADAVFILGDLFEAWVGDDMLELPFERRCADLLAQTSRRLQLGFMPGNRDFLVGQAMHDACGWMPLPDPTVLQAWGQRVLLSHGDAMCLGDEAYQAFRLESRTPAWSQAFLAGSLVERMRRVAQVRANARAGAARENFDAAGWADVDDDAALACLHAAKASTLVHGHTHRPGRHVLGKAQDRVVLSDWDLDAAKPGRAEVLRLTAEGMRRLDVSDLA